MPFVDIGEIGCDPARSLVFEHGWQSWSPTGSYRLHERPPRAADPTIQVLCYRPETPVPDGVFQGEGLLAVDPGDGGPVSVWSAPSPLEVPSIRARREGGRLVVSADGPVSHWQAESGLDQALRTWAERIAEGHAPPAVPAVPPMWCSWYGYWDKVTEADVVDNLHLAARLGIPADMFLLDDGYEAEIGDWLETRQGFGSLERTVGTIREAGKRAGIWVAPFLVGHRSRVFHEHPEWLVGDAWAGHMWDQDLAVLDVTHPGAAEHLVTVFATLRALGITHFKLDYCYAGALPGRRAQDVDPIAAYRRGLELIRQGAGEDAILHGCGAPMLPSLGLVEIMRVSPDVAPTLMPRSGDLSQPSQLGARLAGAAREFLHARWWVNDPDCIIVRPDVEAREDWAAHIEATGGLRGSSDPLAALDEWGLRTTRRLMVPTRTDPS
ncbi:alpha-galactosidase [Thermocatellispora tengchongensis]|uniref:Alpha-galactosidase n=1 Tax=Thermocatellispora tengchongensis TaxID=1073253 RepID=A0A840PDJ3_9ACTN|nr:glycoside hydrolase family 36 protein [Thermocatellispora tengchongensis]MBB5136796.1 alpha-galactosidase [Thermocatellispora tengchongensis]